MHSNTNRECIRVISCNRSIRIFLNIQIGGICRFCHSKMVEHIFARLCTFMYIYVYYKISCTMVSLFSFCPNRSINILVHQFLGKELDGWFRRHTIFSDCIACGLLHITVTFNLALRRNTIEKRCLFACMSVQWWFYFILLVFVSFHMQKSRTSSSRFYILHANSKTFI